MTNNTEITDNTSPLLSNIPTEETPALASRSKFDKTLLLGAWSDGNSENATFDIGKDSIFYLEAMTAFPYTVKGDTLTIMYPDFETRVGIQFSGDTLILNDLNGVATKYTRFVD